MSVLAAIRPDEWNLPLFLHILGAFAVVGALVMAASFLFAGRRGGDSVAMVRLGYRSLLIAALPALLTTRIAAQWLADEEELTDSGLAWIDSGFIASDLGLLVLLGATVAAGLAVRRGEAGRGVGVAAWLVTFLVVVYAIVIWLMATKPA